MKQELARDPRRTPDGPRDVRAGHHLPVRRGTRAVEADGQEAEAAEEVLRGHLAAGEVQLRRDAAKDDSSQKGPTLFERVLLKECPINFIYG